MKFYSIVILGSAFSTALFAATPVGSVSSMGPVEVSGTTMNASTVSSWPLVAGDVIVTGDTPAVVFLTGKGRVTLAANSRVSLEKQGNQLSVRLLGGELNYDLLPSSGLLFFNGSKAVTPAQAVTTPVQGTVSAPNAPAHSASPLPIATAHATAGVTPSKVKP